MCLRSPGGLICSRSWKSPTLAKGSLGRNLVLTGPSRKGHVWTQRGFSCVHLYFQGLLGLNSLSVPLAEERVAMEMLDDRLAARFFVT